MNLLYPTTAEFLEIEQELLPDLTMDDEVFDLFPIQTEDAAELVWYQMDDFTGLQQARGINGQPPAVKKTGIDRYTMTPGVYGEHEVITEDELTRRRVPDAFEQVFSLNDISMVIQNKLLVRRVNRIRQIAWDLLVNGIFSVPGPNGAVIHRDQFPIRTASAAVDWSNRTTATPLADLRAAKLLARGTSNVFDKRAKLFLNQTEVNNLLGNRNAADLGGLRRDAGATFNSLDDVNKIFLDNDLPTVVAYDRTWIDEDKTVKLFIPDGKGVLVGQRANNAPVGAYRTLRNANNEGAAPGPYTLVINRVGEVVPPVVEVHDGHNGGPVLFYPGAIVSMSL